MRRNDKECKDRAEIESFLQKARVVQVAFNTDGEAPYIVPLNFYYSENAIYVHSAMEGRKIELLKENPEAGFCVNEMIKIAPPADPSTPCAAGTRYQSVVGTASAVFLENGKEKILKKLLAKYTALQDVEFKEYYMSNVAVIRFDIKEISYKLDLRGV